jgi:hypothetical protein
MGKRKLPLPSNHTKVKLIAHLNQQSLDRQNQDEPSIDATKLSSLTKPQI